jgi:uncharacterized protein (TIGR03000 family)
MKRFLLAPAALLSMLLMTGGAWAQHGGGHGGGGHGGGGGHSGGGHYGGGHYGGYGGHYGHSYYGGYGLGGLFSPYYGSSYYYGGAPYDYYDSSSTPYSSTPYFSSTPSYAAEPAVAPTASLNIEVHVPTPDAQVWINGQASSRTGTTRSFTVEQIYPDRPYRYEVRATWMQDGRPVTQSRVVTVQAGETSQVVFGGGDV